MKTKTPIDTKISKAKKILQKLEQEKQKKCSHYYVEVDRNIDIWWGWAKFRCSCCGHIHFETY